MTASHRIGRCGVAVALALLLTALPSVAYAKIIGGTPDNDYLLGTTKNDLIRVEGHRLLKTLFGQAQKENCPKLNFALTGF